MQAPAWFAGAVWRQAVRMLVAMAVADALTHALDLPSGYWAMITTAVVVQGNLGGTLDAGLSQLLGTVAGGLLGMGGVVLRTHHLAPDWAVLLGTMIPLALLSARDPHFRNAPVTGLIVLLVTPTSGSSIDLALARIGEITIGSLIGVAVSLLVLPGRARAAMIATVAEALRDLGDLAHALLTKSDAAHRLNIRVRRALAGADGARTDLQREQALRLAGASPVDPLLRTLRRLSVDIAILERAVSQGGDGAAAAPALRHWLHDAADALSQREAAPALGDIAAAVRQVDPAAPLGFCLDVLQRDLADMAARIGDFAQRQKPAG